MPQRWKPHVPITLSLAVALAGCGVATPAAPVATDAPTAIAAPTTSSDPFSGALPLPEMLLPDGEFVASPRSRPSLVEGETVPFVLEHCGLLSPVDVDGSLWLPVGGADANGGPIDSEDEVGDLINATPGMAMLVRHDRLDYRSDGAGVWVTFRRLPGAGRYPICS